ncbi:hypothetical protein ACWEKT_40830 [Nocardia takedensis]
MRIECLNRNHWNTLLEARVVIGDFKADHNLRHRHSALGSGHRPSTLRLAHAPTTRWPAGRTEHGTTPPGLNFRVASSSGTAQRVQVLITGIDYAPIPSTSATGCFIVAAGSSRAGERADDGGGAPGACGVDRFSVSSRAHQ